MEQAAVPITIERRALQPAALLAALLVLVVGVAMFTWKLGTSRLSGTEGHRAITAHQMNQSGEYLVPTLFGYTYLKKPPLQYWIIAAFERLSGQANEWVWRMPSALSAALLAALIVLWVARWRGPRAGLIAGMAQLALVALWSQSRSADIDANNTLATALTGLLLVDLLWLSPRPGWRMVVALALCFGAALMLKGPACLPVVIGAIVGPALVNRTWRGLLRWQVWAALLIGIAILVTWGLAARHAVAVRGMPMDAGGLDEARDRLLVGSWRQLGESLLLPFTVLTYGLPVSLGMIAPLIPMVRRAMDQRERQFVGALAGATAGALVVCVVAGMTNPRHAYMILPMLAPIIGLVGAMWHEGRFSKPQSSQLGGVVLVVSVALAILGAILLFKGRESLSPLGSALWATALGIATVLSVVPIARGNVGRGAARMVALILVCGMLYGVYNQDRRSDRSGYAAGLALGQMIGPGTPVTAWYTIWAQPEVLYYAGVDVRPTPLGQPHDIPTGWVLLYANEYPAWSAQMGERLSRITEIPLNHSRAYLAWYQSPSR